MFVVSQGKLLRRAGAGDRSSSMDVVLGREKERDKDNNIKWLWEVMTKGGSFGSNRNALLSNVLPYILSQVIGFVQH